MKFANLFVVSYGRTGSTALMAVLNGIPGTLIRGENADLVGHLMQVARDLRPHVATKPTTPSDPWFGSENYADRMIIPAFRGLVDKVVLGPNPPPDLRCYGFKEIRYQLDDVEEKLAFLETLYPGAGYIFSVRDARRVARSEFQRGVPKERLDALHGKFSALAERPRSFRVRHEDLVGNTDRLLEDLFAFLDEPLDLAAVKAILAARHSIKGTSPTALWSDYPFFVRPGVEPGGVQMLYINRFERHEGSVEVGGFLRAEASFSFNGIRERSGRRLRHLERRGEMRGVNGASLPVTNFLIEAECPATVQSLDILLATGAVFIEMSNLEAGGTAAGAGH